jgi:hypothetical protein
MLLLEFSLKLVLSIHGSPLPVCTDVEFDVYEICVRLSTLSESLLGGEKVTSDSLNTRDTYFQVQDDGGGPAGTTAPSGLHSPLLFLTSNLINHPVVCLFDTRVGCTRVKVVT